jgi:hypothetical protein
MDLSLWRGFAFNMCRVHPASVLLVRMGQILYNPAVQSDMFNIRTLRYLIYRQFRLVCPRMLCDIQNVLFIYAMRPYWRGRRFGLIKMAEATLLCGLNFVSYFNLV